MLDLDTFIDRWASSGASERANSQLFLAELCDILGVERPRTATDDVEKNTYCFERQVTFTYADHTTSTGFVDLFRQEHFILESKQGSERKAAAATKGKKLKKGTARRGTKTWDEAMVQAREQAERYAKALVPFGGWVPFVLVVDVGHVIEIYADFSRSGLGYVAFPDPLSYRVTLDALRDAKTRDRLKAIWTDPMSLDPSGHAAKVTRAVAEQLATLARWLESDGQPHPPAAIEVGGEPRCGWIFRAEYGSEMRTAGGELHGER